MSSTSSSEYKKYELNLKIKLSPLEIQKIFGTTDIAMLDCSNMVEDEINKLIEKIEE